MTKTTNHSAEFFAELEGDYAPFAGKPKRESHRPWHMHSEAERELVLMDLDAYSKRTGWTKRFAAAYQAAATLLRDAALLPCSGEEWPDEALVVSCATDCVGQRLERRDDTWPLNLSANLAAAGMAAGMERIAKSGYRRRRDERGYHQNMAVDAVATMREAVS